MRLKNSTATRHRTLAGDVAARVLAVAAVELIHVELDGQLEVAGVVGEVGDDVVAAG
jgi:hypothetical protein